MQEPPAAPGPYGDWGRADTVPKSFSALEGANVRSERTLGAANGEDEGILNMENYGSLGMEAFEITEDFLNTPANVGTFHYQRSAKRSILLGLGIVPGKENSNTLMLQDTLNAYSKVSDSACVVTYYAVVVGVGTFSLSQAVAKCGWVLGLGMLLIFASAHSFLCHRIAELPQLLECNFETYSGIGRACFSRLGGSVFVFLSVVCWWGVCAMYLQSLNRYLNDVAHHFWGTGKKAHSCEASIPVKLLCGLPASIIFVLTSAKQLHIVSKYAVRSMLAVAAVEISCALSHLLWNYKTIEHRAWPSIHHDGEDDTWLDGISLEGVEEGVYGMLMAFAGCGMMPYVIAEMLHPQNAKKVVNKAVWSVGSFYVVVGMTCYFGWGQEIEKTDPMKIMVGLGDPYPQLAGLMLVMFVVKTVCSYPLFFWPLIREIDAVLALHESPSVELRLPWAVRQHQKLKIALRVTTVLLTLGPLLLLDCDSQALFKELFVVVVVLVQFLAPAALALKSIVIHKRKIQERGPQLARADSARSLELASGVSAEELQPPITYFGGSLSTHLGATVALSVAISMFSLRLIWRTAASHLPALQAAAPLH